MDENRRVDMILCVHVIFPQGQGTHAQRSGSCLAILLPGVTTHRRTSRGARGAAAPPVAEIFEIFRVKRR